MILHEDDTKVIDLANNGNTLRFTNKASGVTGILEVDGDSVLFGCSARMEIVSMMGNAVVNCYTDPPEDDEDY